MNYQVGDIVRHKSTGEVGIIIKRHHPCADFWLVALPSGDGLKHGTELKPLGDTTIQVGDLIRHKRTGKIGIVTRRDSKLVNYYYVQFHDGTYTIHTQNLELLETK